MNSHWGVQIRWSMAGTVVIAEDHAVTRHGLRAIVEDRFGARVVGATGDGLAVLDLVKEEQPDILILDLLLPGLNGLDVLQRMHRQHSKVHVVVLSMHSDERYVIRALALGASAYVLKGAAATDLVEALEAVEDGTRFLSPALPESLVELAEEDASQTPGDRYEMLTDREREVLQLVAEGLTSQEVGERLFISRRTVEKHRENLMAKLELRNYAELVRYALQRGLIPFKPTGPPDDP